MSYLVTEQTLTALWSGKDIAFQCKIQRQMVRLKDSLLLFWVVLFCFGATVVYITPMKQ